MGKGITNVIEISPCSSKKEERIISLCEDEGTPSRPILCVNKQADLKQIEETDDCFILDFDPFEISKLAISNSFSASDLSVIAEKGQVACRDYPHARHLCVKFPFEKTSHESYCELCYCYVCDSTAPCEFWTVGVGRHCDAEEHVGDWEIRRTQTRNEHSLPKLMNFESDSDSDFT